MPSIYKRTRILMGAPFEIMVEGQERAASEAIEAAFEEAARIEGLFTIYRPKSPLAQFNRASENGVMFFNREISALLSEALAYAKNSGGAFDPSAGPLIDLWGFGPGGTRKSPPTKKEIDRVFQGVGFESLSLNPETGELKSLKPGLRLNLGGIAKGYAIDRAVQVLKDHQINRGLVNCGSTLYGFGDPGWQVTIQHPRSKAGQIAVVMLCNQALGTSGDYERCFLHEGVRYSHLIDPRTGTPVLGMASVSVMASTAMAADALSTAAFVLGAKKGVSFLEKQDGAEGLLVSESPEGVLGFYRTAGWPSLCSKSVLSRRRFLKAASIAGLGLMMPGSLTWPFKSEASSIRFATQEEALKRMMPDAERFDTESVKLSDDQLSAAQTLAGKGFQKKTYDFLIGRKGELVVAYALKLNVIGKKRPITFLIALTPGGEVKGVEVLIYRESKGSEVRYGQFMQQFHQKTTEDPLRLGRDIRPISGATLSSRAAAYAVRKTLAIFEVVYKRKVES